jgi:predicted GNAT family acetyltransferase
MSGNVIDNPSQSRFELKVGDHLAVAYYTLSPGAITFTHTEVPEALSGQGVGTRIARGALEQMRARGLKIVPECPFIAGFIRKNPEFAARLA